MPSPASHSRLSPCHCGFYVDLSALLLTTHGPLRPPVSVLLLLRCTAGLVGERHVVTAGHCFVEADHLLPLRSFVFYLGLHTSRQGVAYIASAGVNKVRTR